VALTIANSVRTTRNDALVDSLDAGSGAGTIKIYSGSRPATPGDAISGTLLVTITCADPAFGASSSGAATISDPAGVAAVATGTASHFRAADSDGNAKFDGSVTATGGGGDLTLATTSIVSGATVDITGGTITEAA
jgi:hypothetical protein